MSCLESSMSIKYSKHRTCFALFELFMEGDLQKNYFRISNIYLIFSNFRKFNNLLIIKNKVKLTLSSCLFIMLGPRLMLAPKYIPSASESGQSLADFPKISWLSKLNSEPFPFLYNDNGGG